MPRKSVVNSNPIRVVRLSHHKTLDSFASECNVHLQALYLNEMGMYPTVLPAIEKRLVNHYEVDPNGLSESYREYVQSKRYSFGSEHQPYNLGEPIYGHNPIKAFRTTLGIETAFGFAIAIAINPTTIRRVERCATENFPGQLRLALIDILLPVGDIDELEYRHQEFYHSAPRFKRAN